MSEIIFDIFHTLINKIDFMPILLEDRRR